jgi:hypothetical protein
MPTLATFHQGASILASLLQDKGGESILSTLSQGKLRDVEAENQLLQAENLRYRKKVEILTRLAQLGPLSFRERKELWAKLAEV